jgi:bidirectional [NiFe] hydrogenase diaphorase subunit
MLIQEELANIAEPARERQAKASHEIRVCMAAGCLSSGSDAVLKALKAVVKERGIEETCLVKGVGCMGPCAGGPLVRADDALYHRVSPQDAAEVVDSVTAKPIERLTMRTDTPFFERQRRIVLENAGRIDPEQLDEYVATGGYQALAKVLTGMTPPEVIDELTRSGLRGRGGAGYPTGLKWSTVAKTGHPTKYIVCNADEGDPGAFMDRSVLESDPHRVLEGMAIAAVTVGAQQGFFYVRAEYPLAVQRVNQAIRQAERAGIIGKRVLGTTSEFHVDVRLGAGAYVCGEETALLASIEGNRGTPRPRPPYPAQAGLWGASTLINNVETLANIPPIINNGGDWYAETGTAGSKGTKVFALAGQVQNTGLIEVPMGTSLREIIFDIGGGVPEGRTFKAVQTGGPSGGCIPAEFLDRPVDYESLAQLGSIMGSGGIIVIDSSSNMVDVAKYFMEFSMSESCGKCVPCRVGTLHTHRLLEGLLAGRGSREDVAKLEQLCDLLKNTSLCGLGQAAPNPVRAALRYFREEFEALLPPEPAPTKEARS